MLNRRTTASSISRVVRGPGAAWLATVILLAAPAISVPARAAIAFKGAASANAAAAPTNLTISVPAATAANDVMIASVTVRACSSTSGGACTVTVAAPAGWTLVDTIDQTTGAGTGGYGNRLLVYQHVASGAEPANYTWTFGGAPAHAGAAGGILSFSGVDTTNPIVVSGGQPTAASYNHTAPSIDTGAVASTMLVSTHTVNSSGTWTPPAGMTEQVDIASLTPPDGLGLAIEINTEFRAVAGATGTRTATLSNPPANDTGATHMLALRPSSTPPPALTLGFCDDFESGLGNWTVASSGGDAGTSTATANSGTSSMFTRWGVVSVTLGAIDTTPVTNSLTVTAWVRRGADAFSEDPDNNEDLVIEYLNNVGTWVTLETFPGNGTPGEIFDRTYALGADAIHANFQLRVRQTGGNGSDFDYWHVDDVCVRDNVNTNTPVAYFAMDESSWNGAAGEVVDSSGNGNNGVAVGGAQTIDPAPTPTPISPGNCRAGATVNEGESIDTGVDVDGAMGNTGTVTFWFRPNWSQSGGERNIARVLFDASMGDKYFKLAKLNNTNNLYPNNNARRRLALLFEDSADNDFVAYTNSEPSFSANTWVHIAVTWDFPGDRFQIYLDGVLAADQTINTNGTIAPLDTLYFGDTRSGYNPYGVTTVANGAFDEVRLYNSVLSQSAIIADRSAAHSCVTVDHYEITYPNGATAVTCESLNVRITAHDASDAAVAVPAGTAMTLNTTTATGVWLSPTVTGTGAWAPSGTNNGQAGYTWPGGESTLEVRLRHNTAVAPIGMNLGGTYSESATEDPAAAFVDSGFRVTDAAGVASVSIGTQIAGKDSNTGLGAQTLFLQAIRTDTGTGSCAGVFPSQTVTVQLASECNNPAACVPTPGSQVRVRNSGALMVPIAQNNNAAVGSYTNVSLAFDAQSKAPLVLNYPDVGQIALHARYALPTPPPAFMLGSSNAFVVKPAGFVISNIIRTSDSFANPAAADATGAAFIHAGDVFTATVTAVANDGVTPTPNFGRESTPEGVVLSQTLIAPAGGNSGALGNATVPGTEFGAGGMVSDANGLATVTNLSWNEVGIIQLSGQIADNNYLGAGAVPNTYTSANIGRITPDHFAVIGAMTLINRSNLVCAGSPFTYLGEPLRLAFQLEARELGGARVSNYLPSGVAASNFAKLDVTTGSVFGALSGISALNTNPDTSSRIAITASGANAWQTGASSGQTNVLAVDVTFARRNDNAVDGAFNGTEIGIAPQDATDNIGLAAAALNRDWVAPAGNDHLLFNTTNLRFGRIALENVFGSELVPLSMGMEAEYYLNAGTGFVSNGDDACTAVTAAQLDLSNDISNPPQGNTTITTNSGPPVTSTTVSIDNTPFSAGAGNLTFTAPGDGGDGFADISVDLSGWSWLKFDWDGNGVNDNDPSARATFGIFEGSPRQIYLRERY